MAQHSTNNQQPLLQGTANVDPGYNPYYIGGNVPQTSYSQPHQGYNYYPNPQYTAQPQPGYNHYPNQQHNHSPQPSHDYYPPSPPNQQYYNQMSVQSTFSQFSETNSYYTTPDQQQSFNKSDYNYDTTNINYQKMTIENWSQIPNDSSQYSQMWSSPRAFEPETFSENTIKAKRKCNDVFWAIFFLLNLIGTIALMIYLGMEFEKTDDSPYLTNSKHEFTPEVVINMMEFGIGTAIVLNIIHMIYATCCPVFYINTTFWIGFVLSVAIAAYPIYLGIYYMIALPTITLLIILIVYCCVKKYIPFSAAVLKVSTKIVAKHFTIFVLILLQAVLEVAILIAFIVAVVFVEYIDFNRWIYLYFLFSYFWITLTLGYVVYLTGSGLAASWYFLNGTEYMPTFPLCSAFGRAITTSFGSAAVAGFLLAIVKTVRTILQPRRKKKSGCGICCILSCIAMCILRMLEACIAFINKYGLIYCAVFGVPFTEGCRRWTELSCHKFCNVLISGCCITTALGFNCFVFTMIGAAFGIAVANWVMDVSYNEIEVVPFVLVCGLMTFAVFVVFRGPIETASDTLIICFSEAPEKLKSSAYELYENIQAFYQRAVDENLQAI